MENTIVKKEELIKDFETNVLNGPFEVCELGSCQYSNINNMIEFINRWRPQYESLYTLLMELGIRIRFTKIQKLEEVQGYFIDWQSIKDNQNNFQSVIYECEKIIQVLKCESFDDIFRALKKSAWDLWSAAESLSNMTFSNLVIECDHEAKTYGPIMNKQAQASGLDNAIQCYLFLENNLIKDFECLKDFDT